jgi:hypothetical protein
MCCSHSLSDLSRSNKPRLCTFDLKHRQVIGERGGGSCHRTTRSRVARATSHAREGLLLRSQDRARRGDAERLGAHLTCQTGFPMLQVRATPTTAAIPALRDDHKRRKGRPVTPPAITSALHSNRVRGAPGILVCHSPGLRDRDALPTDIPPKPDRR